MKRIAILLLLCLAQPVLATTVRIGLFTGKTGSTTDWNVAEGDYILFAGGTRKEVVSTGTSMGVVAGDGQLRCYRGKVFLGSFSRLRLVSLKGDGAMRIRPDSGESWFSYGGHFEMRPHSGKVAIVNVVDLEGYVAAVVESETGANNSPEFLKVQSILCRSYCLSHLDRHAAEGFQLCDRVHCQVYKGKNRFNPMADEAARATRNLVLAESSGRIILAAYHSNCGGQTLPADSVWSRHEEYLQPVLDVNCQPGQHAAWTAMIAKKAWKEYLAAATGESPDSLADSSLAYNSPGRMAAFLFHGKAIPLKKIREDWKLNSTWFDIEVQGDTMVFRGRGFGHGVGLCQEGAMQLAANGWRFIDIIRFYYHRVELADADALELLR